MREIELRRLKHACIKKANNHQEKADCWYAKGREYNDQLVEKWLKRATKKDVKLGKEE